MISPIREEFIFTKLRENKTLKKISEFTILILQMSKFQQYDAQRLNQVSYLHACTL